MPRPWCREVACERQRARIAGACSYSNIYTSTAVPRDLWVCAGGREAGLFVARARIFLWYSADEVRGSKSLRLKYGGWVSFLDG